MNTNEYTRFYIKDINPDFESMGVTHEEFAWTNGKESLLKDGVLYSRCSSDVCDDLGISKDDQIMIVWEFPERWEDIDKSLDCFPEMVWLFMHDYLRNAFGIFSETHQVVLLTESEYLVLQKEPRFLLKTPPHCDQFNSLRVA